MSLLAHRYPLRHQSNQSHRTSSVFSPKPPIARRNRFQVCASRDKDDKINAQKADFSAYWSMRILNIFRKRKQFLEEKKRDLERETDVERRLREKLSSEEQKMAVALEKEDQERAVRQSQQQARRLSSGGIAQDQLIVQELERAVEHLHSRQAVLQLTSNRVIQALKSTLLFPVTLWLLISSSWAGLFNSQRYEYFLMAEGEKMWYWRNRTENERWFWEIYFWNHIALPTIAIVAYEFFVPNNFVWGTVIPFAFYFWKNGSFPALRSVPFWLIAYFGFYCKCWPDAVWLFQAVTSWS